MDYKYSNSKAEFFKNKADYFRGVARMQRKTACVHLEGDSDKPFWESIFARVYPEGDFYFLSYSNNANKARISGVEHCLKYVPYLSGNFFICIDSDYRYITKRKEVDVKDFIFQTYTYSIENHYCYSSHIDQACRQSSGIENTVFDFVRFFKEYSQILYELFIWHLYILKQGLSGMNKFKFNETLTNFPRISLENNGELMLNNLRSRVARKLSTLRLKYPEVDISEYYRHFGKLGLTPDNTYLYLRGHNIYDFTMQLGRICCRAIRDVRREQSADGVEDIELSFGLLPSFKESLHNSLAQSNYHHLSRIYKDIEYYRNYLERIR